MQLKLPSLTILVIGIRDAARTSYLNNLDYHETGCIIRRRNFFTVLSR
jgi:hypothetical protein